MTAPFGGWHIERRFGERLAMAHEVRELRRRDEGEEQYWTPAPAADSTLW